MLLTATIKFGSLLNALPGSVAQGLIWGILAIGVYMTFRLLDFADLTVDGSFATGAAVAVMLIRAGVSPWIAIVVWSRDCFIRHSVYREYLPVY